MFGPFRSCIYPRIFRSIKVKKATAIRIGTIYMSGDIRLDSRVFIVWEGS